MDDFGFNGPRRSLIWRILLGPFDLIAIFLRRFAGDDLQSKLGFWGWMWLIFVAPFTITASSLWSLFVVWSSSRRMQSFAFGIPSLLFALTIITLFVAGSLRDGQIVKAYEKGLALAKESENLEQAELYLNRMMRTDVANREAYQLEKAELLVKQEKLSEAIPLLKDLAKIDEVGNPKAHLALARYYISEEFARARNVESLSPADRLAFANERRQVSIAHLQKSLDSSPERETEFAAHTLMYVLKKTQLDLDGAAQHLYFLNRFNPAYAVEHYVFFTKLLERKQTAESQADIDTQRFREILNREPGNKQVWSLLLQLLMLRDKYDEALKDLDDAFRRASETEHLQFLLVAQSGVMVKKARWLTESQGALESRQDRLSLLSEALKTWPLNQAAIEQLVILGFPFEDEGEGGGDGDEWLYEAKARANPGDSMYYGVNLILGLRAKFEARDDEAKQYFDTAAKLDGRLSSILNRLEFAVDPSQEIVNQTPEQSANNSEKAANSQQGLFNIYMILGSHSAKEEQYKRATSFFENALKANPTSVEAKNNLVFCQINQPGVTTQELQAAMILITDIINQSPTVRNFYETRGQINLRLEDYAAAIADFERALELGYTNSSKVRENLVIAYRKVGRDKEADAFEKLLALENKMSDEPEMAPIKESSVPETSVPQSSPETEGDQGKSDQ